MNKEERLELENELLMTCSKAQAINKYIDELEENMILTNQWYKSQQEKQEWVNLLDMFKNQQKEFIKFLEDNYKETQDIWYIKILQKYKEIIGGK